MDNYILSLENPTDNLLPTDYIDCIKYTYMYNTNEYSEEYNISNEIFIDTPYNLFVTYMFGSASHLDLDIGIGHIVEPLLNNKKVVISKGTKPRNIHAGYTLPLYPIKVHKTWVAQCQNILVKYNELENIETEIYDTRPIHESIDEIFHNNFNAGIELLEKHKIKGAIIHFMKCLEIIQNDAKTLYCLMCCYVDTDFEKAFEYFELCIANGYKFKNSIHDKYIKKLFSYKEKESKIWDIIEKHDTHHDN
jgi:tetratricopeptide (TPR) repeat protein